MKADLSPVDAGVLNYKPLCISESNCFFMPLYCNRGFDNHLISASGIFLFNALFSESQMKGIA